MGSSAVVVFFKNGIKSHSCHPWQQQVLNEVNEQHTNRVQVKFSYFHVCVCVRACFPVLNGQKTDKSCCMPLPLPLSSPQPLLLLLLLAALPTLLPKSTLLHPPRTFSTFVLYFTLSHPHLLPFQPSSLYTVASPASISHSSYLVFNSHFLLPVKENFHFTTQSTFHLFPLSPPFHPVHSQASPLSQAPPPPCHCLLDNNNIQRFQIRKHAISQTTQEQAKE